MKKVTLANQELEKFLRKEKVLTKFVKNTNKHYKGHDINLVYGAKSLELAQCFIFCKTLEGYDFWDNLNDEFKKTY